MKTSSYSDPQGAPDLINYVYFDDGRQFSGSVDLGGDGRLDSQLKHFNDGTVDSFAYYTYNSDNELLRLVLDLNADGNIESKSFFFTMAVDVLSEQTRIPIITG